MTLILNPNIKDATTINLSKFHLLIGNRHFSIEDLSGDLVIESLFTFLLKDTNYKYLNNMPIEVIIMMIGMGLGAFPK